MEDFLALNLTLMAMFTGHTIKSDKLSPPPHPTTISSKQSKTRSIASTPSKTTSQVSGCANGNENKTSEKVD